MKELGCLHVLKKSGDNIIPDIGTKNTKQKQFKKQTIIFMTGKGQK